VQPDKSQIQGTSVQSVRPGSSARLGAIVIAFSTLCFLVFPAFTPSFILSLLFGIFSGVIAFALKARRAAIVALVFAPTPLCGFLLLDYFANRFHSGYAVFAILGVAYLTAILALANYSMARRVSRRPSHEP
jgi:hypothetical protein